MAKKIKKEIKKEPQVVEIHIYVHQNIIPTLPISPGNYPNTTNPTPPPYVTFTC